MIRNGQIVQLCAAALLGVGVVMIHSAGMVIGQPAAEPWSVLVSRPALYAGLALAVMLLAGELDVRSILLARGLLRPLPLAMLLALGLTAATLAPGMGHQVNGASRWLRLGPLTFQPSELLKWLTPLALACWCARRRGAMHRLGVGLLPPLLLLGVVCGAIVIEDLGTAVLVAAAGCVLLCAGGGQWWHLGLLAPAPAAALVFFIYTSPYRLARLTAFLDPWADPQGSGYHPIQSMLAIAMGGLTGRGLGNGIQKFGYLPEDKTDFIFAIICEELGLAGAGLVVALYLILLWAALGVLRDCKDLLGRLVVLGILVTVGLQALINVAVVTVVVPTKGIALPLVSSGGSGWIMTAFALGLVAALDKANALQGAEAMDAAASQQGGGQWGGRQWGGRPARRASKMPAGTGKAVGRAAPTVSAPSAVAEQP